MSMAKRMMSWLPRFWHENAEMKEILKAQGAEFERIKERSNRITTDAFILTASESRIAEWEKDLRLPPTGTLEERRLKVYSYYAVALKFNSESIKTIVSQLYNGARAYPRFVDGEFKITVVPLPERFMDELDFSLLLNQIEALKPCHLGASAERGYSTWGDIKDNFENWEAVKKHFKNWEEVLMYIPR